MAGLISKATGNFTASTTWGVLDATSFLNSEASNAGLTTSYVESASFTPGAITIDGIAVKIRSRADSPSGTMSIRLAQGGSTVSGTEVTVNVTDINNELSTNDLGWHFFKFSSPVTLLAATAYTVSAKVSVNSQVALFTNATTNNWSRMLRTTTEQAPAAGDVLRVMGELTGAGTGNDITVTMDNTATTDFGPGTDGNDALTISKRGKLSYAYSASTAYYLKLSGNLIVYSGGTLEIGTVANPIPRNSTAVLEFDPVADGGMGLICYAGSTLTIQGLSRTSGKNIVSCLLNTDEAAGQTTLGVDTDTGWLASDVVAIASTTRTASQTESRTLNADAGASSIVVSSGLTNAHSGTSPTQAEVILLTRNVKVRSATSTLMTYVYLTEATVDIDWCEFRYLGDNTATKRGIEIGTLTTTSINIQYCSIYECEDWGVYIAGGTSSGSVVFSNNVTYYTNNARGASTASVLISSPNATFDSNIFLRADTGSNFYGIQIGPLLPASFKYNTVVQDGASAGGAGIGLSLTQVSDQAIRTGIFENNTVHSCAGRGIWSISSSILNLIELKNSKVWRCGGVGILLNGVNDQVAFDTLEAFGNTTSSLEMLGNTSNLLVKSMTSSGDSSFATTNGIGFISTVNNIAVGIRFENCDFSPNSGIKVAHTNDLFIYNPMTHFVQADLYNCKLQASIEVLQQSYNYRGGYIRSTRHDQSANNHKSWYKFGTITSDSSIYRTATPSERLTPTSSSHKLNSGSKKVAVNSGETVDISCYVRESVAGDGTDYNGNRPRLILKANPSIGVNSDTVIDTATASAEGAFEQLTGTTAAATDDGVMEFYVDCDGTGGGWINIDDWSVS